MMSDYLVSFLKHRSLVLESLENRDLMSGLHSVMPAHVINQIPSIVCIQSSLLAKASAMQTNPTTQLANLD